MSPTWSPGAVDDHRRTTLSFLVATFAVAVSTFLGLGQAAASAATADLSPAENAAFTTASIGSDPAPPSIAPARTDPGPANELLAALGRLDRVPEPIAGATPGATPATSTTTAAAPPSITDAPSSAGPTERSTTSTAFTQTSTAEAPSPGPSATPVTASTPTTTSTEQSTPVATRPAGTERRAWRPVSRASFRRFVDARDFTTVEYLTPGLVHGTIVGDEQRVNVVLVHRSATAPMRVSPVHRGPEPVGEWARAIGATAGINANWYDPFDGPAVSAGRPYGGSDHGYTALFGFTADGDLVADHHHKIHDRIDPRVVEAVSGHPTLIHRGAATTDFGTDPTFIARHPRTAIGVSASVDVLILVTVDGRRGDAIGMTGVETTRLMERLGAHDAVMLDGGGSSALWIAGRGIVNRQSDPGRAVGNQIAVFGR